MRDVNACLLCARGVLRILNGWATRVDLLRRKFCSSYDWRGSTSRREGGQVVGTLTARLRRSFYNPVFRQPTGLEIVTGMWHKTVVCPALAAPPRAVRKLKNTPCTSRWRATPKAPKVKVS